MLVPSAVGALLDGRPWLLAWAELFFVCVQTACYAAVAALPLYDAAAGGAQSSSCTSSTLHEGGVELQSADAPSFGPADACDGDSAATKT